MCGYGIEMFCLTLTDEGCSTLKEKSQKAECLAKQKYAAKAVMPGHLADIIFRQKSPVVTAEGNQCVSISQSPAVRGTWIINSGRLWEYT